MSRGARCRSSNFFPLSPFHTLYLLFTLLMLFFSNVLSNEQNAGNYEESPVILLPETTAMEITAESTENSSELINGSELSKISLNPGESIEKISNEGGDGENVEPLDIEVESNGSNFTTDSNFTIHITNEAEDNSSEGVKTITLKAEVVEYNSEMTPLNLVSYPQNSSRYDNDSVVALNGQRTTERVKLGESPFLGFVGSQKFPIRPTYKPLPPFEKFDRRHFGLNKPEVEYDEEKVTVLTLEPDLPKSPSRDVNYNQKIERKNIAEEDYYPESGEIQNLSEEVKRKSAETFHNGSLPGTYPGLRALGTPSNASFFDGSNGTLPGSGAGSRTGGVRGQFDINFEDVAFTKRPTVRTDDYGIPRELNSDLESFKNQFNSEVIRRTSVGVSGGEKINVTILGLFELTQGLEPRPEGLSELQAARLAVRRINEMEKIPKFRIHLAHNDTKVRFLSSYSRNIILDVFLTRVSRVQNYTVSVHPMQSLRKIP